MTHRAQHHAAYRATSTTPDDEQPGVLRRRRQCVDRMLAHDVQRNRNIRVLAQVGLQDLRDRLLSRPVVASSVLRHRRHRHRVDPGVDCGDGLSRGAGLGERKVDRCLRDFGSVDPDDYARARGAVRQVRWHRDDGAMSVAGHIHRGGPGDQVRETTRAVRADDDQARFSRLLDQRRSGCVINEPAGDAQAGVARLGLFDVLLEQITRGVVSVAHNLDVVAGADAQVPHGRCERVNQPHWRMPAFG